MSARPTVAMLTWMARIEAGEVLIYKRHSYSLGLSMLKGERFTTPPRAPFIESMVAQGLLRWGAARHHGFGFRAVVTLEGREALAAATV